MKVDLIELDNLSSYINETIRFDDYNIVIGPNGSGKTNLIRILKFISYYGFYDKTPRNPTHISLMDLELPDDMRFDKDKPSSITITFSLNEEEIRLLLQLLKRTDLAKQSFVHINPFKLTIYWKKTSNEMERATFIALQCGQQFILWNETSYGDNLCFINDKFKKLDIKIDRVHNLISYLDNKQSLTVEELNNFLTKFNFGIHDILNKYDLESYKFDLSNFSSFNLLDKKIVLNMDYQRLDYNSTTPVRYVAEILDYCNINRKGNQSLLSNISLWNLLSFFFNTNITYLNENRYTINEIAEKLYFYSKRIDFNWIYEYVNDGFKKLFPNVEFKVLSEEIYDHSNKKIEVPYILINETVGFKKNFRLEKSASGYYEALSIFTSIASQTDKIIILDEPALHLHPIKIKFLGRYLMQIPRTQIIIITHSPFFVEVGIFSLGRNLIYIRKNVASSKVFNKPIKFNPKLTSFNFKPDIFFSKFNIILEGAGDAAVFSAISDVNHSILEKNDIYIVDSGGKGGVKKYRDLFRFYDVNYHAIADIDYEYETDNKITLLQGKLEDELKKLGWTQQIDTSANPEKVYIFIFNLMQDSDGKNKIGNSIFGKIINQALTQLEIKSLFP